MKKLGLSARVFIGFALGILLGVIFGEKILVIKFIGDIFLNLIKMITVPVVFFSIVSGITNLTDAGKLRHLGGKILAMYVITTIIGGLIGIAVAHIINPGIGFTIDSSTLDAYEATAMNSVGDTLVSMVPSNIVAAMANTNMMGIIIFCALFGTAMVMLGEKVPTVKHFFEEGTQIMYRMTALIMELSPFGVGALLACTVGQYGIKVFGPLGKFIACDYINCAIIVFVMYFIILQFMGKVKFPYFMKKVLPLWAMTAATTSSAGCVPITMGIARDDFQIEEELYGFSIPLGATINMNAGGAYYSAAVVFAAQIYGVNLTLTQELTIVLLATLISVGSPGIPGGGIVMTVMLLTTMGLPVEIMGMIAGIYKILDMAHTTINCTGDLVSTIAVARSENMMHDDYAKTHAAK